MATTKTLTPTNQTITIDAFQGEKPDHRHVADAETKLADAVNALNSQITIKVGTNLTSVDAVNSALNTLNDSLSDMNVRNVSFTCSTGIESPFTNASYGGVFVRHSSTRARVIVMRSGYHEILTGWLGNNGWTWESLDIAGREVVETPTQPTYTNVVNSSYSNRFYVRKCGKIVTIGGEFKAGQNITSTAVVIATGLPPAYSASLGQFTAIAGSNAVHLDVDASGNFTTMYAGDISSGTVVRFGHTYIANS